MAKLDSTAKRNIEILETLLDRISGCRVLLGAADEEIRKKITRIRDKESKQERIRDKTEKDRQDRISLEGSAKLWRATEDLDAVRYRVNAVIGELQEHTGERITG